MEIADKLGATGGIFLVLAFFALWWAGGRWFIDAVIDRWSLGIGLSALIISLASFLAMVWM